MFFTFLTYYLIAINIFATIICLIDKISAIYGKRRVSEKFLMLISLFGGSLFMYLTMKVIRHKTLHKKFMVGLPLMIVSQIIILLMIQKII